MMTAFGEYLWEVWGWLGAAAQNAAGAADTTLGLAPEFPFWQHLARVGAVLAGMLGLLLLGLYLWKRSVALRPGGASPLIQVLATHYLAPKKVLILVAVGKERLLLASSGEQLQLLATLPPDEVPEPAGREEEPESPVMLALKNEREGRG